MKCCYVLFLLYYCHNIVANCCNSTKDFDIKGFKKFLEDKDKECVDKVKNGFKLEDSNIVSRTFELYTDEVLKLLYASCKRKDDIQALRNVVKISKKKTDSILSAPKFGNNSLIVSIIFNYKVEDRFASCCIVLDINGELVTKDDLENVLKGTMWFLLCEKGKRIKQQI